MAYPTVDKTYGFQAVNRIDGLPYAGAIRQIPIAAGYATAILNGDTVVVNTDGFLVAATTTNSGNRVGVLVGCSYVNSSSQPVQGNNYPAAQSTAANLAYGYVVDDPMAAFRVVATVVGSTTPTGYTRALVASNVAIVATAGNTTTGDSYYGIDGSSADTAATLPIRVIDVVPESSYISSGTTYYYEFIVKINTHQYNNTTGV